MVDDAQKRVLFIQTQAENAGAQEISRLVGNGLEVRGYDVHHLFFYRKSDGFDGRVNTTICCPERPSGLLSKVVFIKNLVRTIRDLKPDVAFTFQHFGNVLGAPAARLAGVSHVIANQVSARETIHPILRYADLGLGLCGVYDAITVNSHDLLQDYSDFPKRYTKKIIHVPHGFEDKTTSITKDEARRQLNIPLEVPLLGTVARLNEAKQIDCAIRLLSHDPDWHLLIAGQGPDENRLKQIAAELNVTERVIFLGEVPQNDVGRALTSLDVFVFPTRAETFGLAAVEAGQAGLPVVANNLDVLREVLVVDKGPCADFVDVKDIQAFADAVAKVLNDEKHRQMLSARGLDLKHKYSLDRMIASYEDMIIGKNGDSVNHVHLSAA